MADNKITISGVKIVLVTLFTMSCLGTAIISTAWLTRSVWLYPRLNSHAYDVYPHLLEIFYRRKDASVPPDTVILIGDSHIQGLAASALDYRSENFGIGGDTVSGVRRRLTESNSVGRAKAVIVQVGYNDINISSPVQISADYSALLDHNSVVPFILNAVFYVDEPIDLERNEIITNVNAEFSGIANKRENVHFLDINALIAPNKRLLSEMHLGDGLHLSTTGYGIWIEQLNILLSELENEN